LDEQPRPGATAVVDDVTPLEREGFAGPEALVGEHAHQRGVGGLELAADCLDGLGRARVDRLVADVRQPAHPEHGVPLAPAPLDGAVEGALEQPERAVDRRHAGAVGPQRCGVGVDRLAA